MIPLSNASSSKSDLRKQVGIQPSQPRKMKTSSTSPRKKAPGAGSSSSLQGNKNLVPGHAEQNVEELLRMAKTLGASSPSKARRNSPRKKFSPRSRAEAGTNKTGATGGSGSHQQPAMSSAKNFPTSSTASNPTSATGLLQRRPPPAVQATPKVHAADLIATHHVQQNRRGGTTAAGRGRLSSPKSRNSRSPSQPITSGTAPALGRSRIESIAVHAALSSSSATPGRPGYHAAAMKPHARPAGSERAPTVEASQQSGGGGGVGVQENSTRRPSQTRRSLGPRIPAHDSAIVGSDEEFVADKESTMRRNTSNSSSKVRFSNTVEVSNMVEQMSSGLAALEGLVQVNGHELREKNSLEKRVSALEAGRSTGGGGGGGEVDISAVEDPTGVAELLKLEQELAELQQHLNTHDETIENHKKQMISTTGQTAFQATNRFMKQAGNHLQPWQPQHQNRATAPAAFPVPTGAQPVFAGGGGKIVSAAPSSTNTAAGSTAHQAAQDVIVPSQQQHIIQPHPLPQQLLAPQQQISRPLPQIVTPVLQPRTTVPVVVQPMQLKPRLPRDSASSSRKTENVAVLAGGHDLLQMDAVVDQEESIRPPPAATELIVPLREDDSYPAGPPAAHLPTGQRPVVPGGAASASGPNNAVQQIVNNNKPPPIAVPVPAPTGGAGATPPSISPASTSTAQHQQRDLENAQFPPPGTTDTTEQVVTRQLSPRLPEGQVWTIDLRTGQPMPYDPEIKQQKIIPIMPYKSHRPLPDLMNRMANRMASSSASRLSASATSLARVVPGGVAFRGPSTACSGEQDSSSNRRSTGVAYLNTSSTSRSPGTRLMNNRATVASTRPRAATAVGLVATTSPGEDERRAPGVQPVAIQQQELPPLASPPTRLGQSVSYGMLTSPPTVIRGTSATAAARLPSSSPQASRDERATATTTSGPPPRLAPSPGGIIPTVRSSLPAAATRIRNAPMTWNLPDYRRSKSPTSGGFPSTTLFGAAVAGSSSSSSSSKSPSTQVRQINQEESLSKTAPPAPVEIMNNSVPAIVRDRDVELVHVQEGLTISPIPLVPQAMADEQIEAIKRMKPHQREIMKTSVDELEINLNLDLVSPTSRLVNTHTDSNHPAPRPVSTLQADVVSRATDGAFVARQQLRGELVTQSVMEAVHFEEEMNEKQQQRERSVSVEEQVEMRKEKLLAGMNAGGGNEMQKNYPSSLVRPTEVRHMMQAAFHDSVANEDVLTFDILQPPVFEDGAAAGGSTTTQQQQLKKTLFATEDSISKKTVDMAAQMEKINLNSSSQLLEASTLSPGAPPFIPTQYAFAGQEQAVAEAVTGIGSPPGSGRRVAPVVFPSPPRFVFNEEPPQASSSSSTAEPVVLVGEFQVQGPYEGSPTRQIKITSPIKLNEDGSFPSKEELQVQVTPLLNKAREEVLRDAQLLQQQKIFGGIVDHVQDQGAYAEIFLHQEGHQKAALVYGQDGHRHGRHLGQDEENEQEDQPYYESGFNIAHVDLVPTSYQEQPPEQECWVDYEDEKTSQNPSDDHAGGVLAASTLQNEDYSCNYRALFPEQFSANSGWSQNSYSEDEPPEVLLHQEERTQDVALLPPDHVEGHDSIPEAPLPAPTKNSPHPPTRAPPPTVDHAGGVVELYPGSSPDHAASTSNYSVQRRERTYLSPNRRHTPYERNKGFEEHAGRNIFADDFAPPHLVEMANSNNVAPAGPRDEMPLEAGPVDDNMKKLFHTNMNDNEGEEYPRNYKPGVEAVPCSSSKKVDDSLELSPSPEDESPTVFAARDNIPVAAVAGGHDLLHDQPQNAVLANDPLPQQAKNDFEDGDGHNSVSEQSISPLQISTRTKSQPPACSSPEEFYESQLQPDYQQRSSQQHYDQQAFYSQNSFSKQASSSYYEADSIPLEQDQEDEPMQSRNSSVQEVMQHFHFYPACSVPSVISSVVDGSSCTGPLGHQHGNPSQRNKTQQSLVQRVSSSSGSPLVEVALGNLFRKAEATQGRSLFVVAAGNSSSAGGAAGAGTTPRQPSSTSSSAPSSSKLTASKASSSTGPSGFAAIVEDRTLLLECDNNYGGPVFKKVLPATKNPRAAVKSSQQKPLVSPNVVQKKLVASVVARGVSTSFSSLNKNKQSPTVAYSRAGHGPSSRSDSANSRGAAATRTRGASSVTTNRSQSPVPGVSQHGLPGSARKILKRGDGYLASKLKTLTKSDAILGRAVSPALPERKLRMKAELQEVGARSVGARSTTSATSRGGTSAVAGVEVVPPADEEMRNRNTNTMTGQEHQQHQLRAPHTARAAIVSTRDHDHEHTSHRRPQSSRELQQARRPVSTSKSSAVTRTPRSDSKDAGAPSSSAGARNKKTSSLKGWVEVVAGPRGPSNKKSLLRKPSASPGSKKHLQLRQISTSAAHTSFTSSPQDQGQDTDMITRRSSASAVCSAMIKKGATGVEQQQELPAPPSVSPIAESSGDDASSDGAKNKPVRISLLRAREQALSSHTMNSVACEDVAGGVVVPEQGQEELQGTFYPSPTEVNKCARSPSVLLEEEEASRQRSNTEDFIAENFANTSSLFLEQYYQEQQASTPPDISSRDY
ncbi:unnamed protein product [Amoebophrya sp. A120]|nr:unnamed protein product [Amoebophrya sp. A120]|eukprot:GSA120T00001276001.1